MSGTRAQERSPLAAATLVWVARTVAPLVRLGLVIVISRALGATGLGAYQVMVANLAVFELVPSLGLWPLIIRDVARTPASASRYLLHATALCTAAAMVLIGPMYYSSAGYDPTVRAGMLVLSFSLLPSVLITVSEAILTALGRPQTVAVLRIAENAVLVAAAALLVRAGHGLVAVTGAMLVCRVLCAAAALLMSVLACPTVEWKLERSFAAHLLREAPVFLGSTVVWALYTRIDILFLSRTVSLEQVGLYGSAQRLLATCQDIPTSALLVVLPMLSAAYGRQLDEFASILRRTVRYLLAIALPAAVVSAVLGPSLLAMLFGSEFRAAGPVLSLLMWSFVPFCLMKLFGTALIATNSQKADLAINVVVLIVTTALLALLVPGGGVLGAGWALLGSAVTGFVLRLGYLRLRVHRIGLEARSLATVLAAVVLAFVLFATRALPLPLALAAGGVAYLAGLVLFGALAPDELALVPGLKSLAARRGVATASRGG